MAAPQERYVTSNGIEKVRKKVTNEIKPVLEKAHTDIDTTGVSFPGFGLLGEAVFGWKYSELQGYAKQILAEGTDTLTQWDTALADIESKWKAAENNSTLVVYQ
ncbi:MAG: hypothetical protein JWN00_2495 [Actinomycetia bacterium]|jgi:hypothetical protein|nr:hypothetical protein [Actinomycetes bacterium]